MIGGVSLNRKQSSCFSTLLLVLLFAPLFSCATIPRGWDDVASVVPLPDVCLQNCVSEFGAPLGTTPGQVSAYSNCNSQCVVYRAHRMDGAYTGIEWQCVEFARRWLLVQKGLVYGDVDIAADIWNNITYLTDISGARKVPLRNYPNGSDSLPQVGDMLVYAREYLGTGHIAIVLAVDPQRGVLQVGEQNYQNAPWPGAYAREIAFIQQSSQVWVLDPYLVGWKRMAANAVQ